MSDIFYLQIPLFWANREMILKEPRYYSITAPHHFYAMMYMLAGNPIVNLGQLLQIWEKEKIFSVECGHCGGKAVVFRFGGSPLSGTVFELKTICLACGKLYDPPNRNTFSFGKLRIKSAKYPPIEPIAEMPASVQELVAACKGEEYVPEDKTDNQTEVTENTITFGQPFVQIGKKKLTTEQFSALIAGKKTWNRKFY